MVHIEYDEVNDKSNSRIEGDLDLIYAELGLAVLHIANVEDLKMSIDDVLRAIKDTIKEKIGDENAISS